ncbi:PREDICTED: TEX13 family member C [Myotis davidii]|uniref:TEX13 family member C n=1 Tax=Myotis davidii TaxID=225400 RepID=UPI0003EC2C6A|nr:PREDICTED: TEX13 family member C [Myotis davidii]
MAANFGDCAGGFRHDEVISFINNEVLLNGGGRDFYTTLRSQSWNEIEDRLQAVLTDPQVPRMRQRASTWSALALGVRVAARQREQLVCQVRQLQDRVEELEETASGLAPELQRLHVEHENMTLQLYLTRTALEQALNERDMLHSQLPLVAGSVQVARMSHEMMPGPQPGWFGASAWPLNEEQQRNMEAMGMPGSPWAQNMPPPLPVLVPYSFPFHPPFPPESPFLPPLPPGAVFMEAGGAVMLPNPPPGFYTPNLPPGFYTPNLPPGFYTPNPWAAVWAQEEMAPLWNHRIPSQEEGPEFLQGTVPFGDIRSLSQEQDLERPQGMVNLSDNRNHSHEDSAVGPQGIVPLWDCWSHSQEQHLERSQGMVTMSDIRNSQEEGPERPQNMVPLEASGRQGQKESSERPQGVVHLGGNKSHCQEGDPESPQGTVPLGSSGSQSQEGDPESPQGTVPLGSSGSQSQEVPESPQGTVPLGSSGSQSQEVPESPQGTVPLGSSGSQSQEVPESPQGTVPLGGSGSQSQEGDPQTPQGTSLGGRTRHDMRENKKKQQFWRQKSKQPEGIRASESQHHEMSALYYNGQKWHCNWCRGVNFPWRKFCHVCRKFCI